jgi:hypothetical protein
LPPDRRAIEGPPTSRPREHPRSACRPTSRHTSRTGRGSRRQRQREGFAAAFDGSWRPQRALSGQAGLRRSGTADGACGDWRATPSRVALASASGSPSIVWAGVRKRPIGWSKSGSGACTICLMPRGVSGSSRVSPPLGGDRRFTTRTGTHCWPMRLWWLGRADPALARVAWCLARHLRPQRVVETGVGRRAESRVGPSWRHWSGMATDTSGASTCLHRSPQRFFGRRASPFRAGCGRGGPTSAGRAGGDSRAWSQNSRRSTSSSTTVWPAVRAGGLILVDDVNLNGGFEVFTGRRGRNLRARPRRDQRRWRARARPDSEESRRLKAFRRRLGRWSGRAVDALDPRPLRAANFDSA